MLGFLYHLADGARWRARRKQWPADQAAGRRGEDIAHRFLQRSGIVIVARNYRLPAGAGEIDLIGWDRDTLVFVEVKSRHTDEYGLPERAIDREKELRIIRAARQFARHAEVPWENVRFDVVSVILRTPPEVRHVRDAFGEKER